MSLPLVPFLIGVGTATAATLSLATQLGIRGQMTGLHDKAEMEFNEKLFKYKKLEAEKLKEVVAKERQPEPITVKQIRETSHSVTMRVLQFVDTALICSCIKRN